MKIYNKKYFAYGLASLALGIAVFVTAERPVEIKPIVLALLCAIIGVGFIFRSFSRELTKADKLDELDERNQLIALKSNSKTSQITQLGSGILTVAFIGMGGGSGNKDFITMGVGAAFCFTISLFAEMFTKIYYEKHN